MRCRLRSNGTASGAMPRSRSRAYGSRFESLSTRQRDVLSLVASGLMNKQVAAELGLAEITVKIYRGQIMRKMGAKSLADLVRMTDALGIPRTRGSLQT